MRFGASATLRRSAISSTSLLISFSQKPLDNQALPTKSSKVSTEQFAIEPTVIQNASVHVGAIFVTETTSHE